MTLTVSAWLVWLVAAFALAGAYAVWTVLAAGVLSAVTWWRDRREPGDEESVADMLAASLAALPPERSREELGFTEPQPAVVLGGHGRRICPECHADEGSGTQLVHGVATSHIPGCGTPLSPFAADNPNLSPHRERRAPWWEVQQRAAYESLGLEYPSGLLARVREAGQ